MSERERAIRRVLERFKRVRRCGKGYSARCSAHDDRGPSLSITPVSDRILLYCFALCSFQDILKSVQLTPADLVLDPAGATAAAEEYRLRKARQLWESTHCARGTIVGHYLQSRGIKIQPPAAIRFLPSLTHREFGWPFPAMVAGVQGASGEFRGVAVTYLAADGRDKAPVVPDKMTFGPVGGGAVRLAGPGPTLCLAEGIETALSIMQATSLPAWATLGTSNLSAVRLPPEVKELVICADGDAAGLKAAETAARRLHLCGTRVRIAPAPQGADYNDLLRG